MSVPSGPGQPTSGPGPDGTGDGSPGLSWAQFIAGLRDYERTGMCSHPVRLKGTITAIDLATGEARPMYDTASDRGGVLLTACGNRREHVCPACSAVYKRDARQLVRWAHRRQGSARHDRHPPVRVHYPHRTIVRPRPLPPDARQDLAALPSPP